MEGWFVCTCLCSCFYFILTLLLCACVYLSFPSSSWTLLLLPFIELGRDEPCYVIGIIGLFFFFPFILFFDWKVTPAAANIISLIMLAAHIWTLRQRRGSMPFHSPLFIWPLCTHLAVRVWHSVSVLRAFACKRVAASLTETYCLLFE